MLAPIIDDLEKLVEQFKTALLVIVVGALMLWVGRCTARKDGAQAERIKVLTHTVMVAETLYVHDTVTAYRTRIRYDRTQTTDTVMRHDSVFVYKPLADTAINACTVALHDCDRLRLVNDSLTKALNSVSSPSLAFCTYKAASRNWLRCRARIAPKKDRSGVLAFITLR